VISSRNSVPAPLVQLLLGVKRTDHLNKFAFKDHIHVHFFLEVFTDSVAVDLFLGQFTCFSCNLHSFFCKN